MSMLAQTLPAVQIDLASYLAQYREYLRKHSPDAIELRGIAPADVEALPEGPGEEDAAYWAATSNEEEVILDVAIIEEQDRDEMYRFGRGELPWL